MTHARAQAVRRRDRLEALNAVVADDRREHAESLLRGIDALTRKFAQIPDLPLDVIDRAERIAVAWHVSNVERVASVSDAVLARLEEQG